MTAALLLVPFLTPVVLAGFDVLWRREHRWLAAAGAAPALVLAAVLPRDLELHLDWLFLGARFELDPVGRWFLLISAALWLLGGVYGIGYNAGDPKRRRYTRLYLLTMAGNFGVTACGDALSYLLFFAVMSFSAYGLVVHTGTPEARRAARVYVTLVIASEVLLFIVLGLLAGGGAATDFPALRQSLALHPAGTWLTALVVAGFGIKLGLVPLHFWLPLAHPAAPTPASAVLSGAIIKTGLLGWLRLLPLGLPGLEVWGLVLLAVGLGGAFYGVAVGVGQADPKTMLAYSSISQMGLLVAAVGAGLHAPEAWPALEGAVLVYALHHAVAKAGLFFSVGVLRGGGGGRTRSFVLAALIVLAASLAGAPATSGETAKAVLKVGLLSADAGRLVPLKVLLTSSALATALLMGRLTTRVWKMPADSHGAASPALWLPVAATAAAAVGLPWVLPALGLAPAPALYTAAGSAWPLVAGAGLAFVLRNRDIRWIPAGDLLYLCRAMGRQPVAASRPTLPHAEAEITAPESAERWRARGAAALDSGEAHLSGWPVAGFLVVALILLLWWTVRH